MAVGLLPAAGMARRLGISHPKELLGFEGRPVIDYALDHLVEAGVDALVVVIRPGKEAVAEHVAARRLGPQLVVAEQDGEIGNLLDGVRAGLRVASGQDVLLAFPDTFTAPNPFRAARRGELLLLCHDAGPLWRQFGVLDPAAGVVVEKAPAELTAPPSTLCWGAASWSPAFSARLTEPATATVTEAINAVRWEHALTIERYVDIGLGIGLGPDAAPPGGRRLGAGRGVERAPAG